jgi:hypothetical protein
MKIAMQQQGARATVSSKVPKDFADVNEGYAGWPRIGGLL